MTVFSASYWQTYTHWEYFGWFMPTSAQYATIPIDRCGSLIRQLK